METFNISRFNKVMLCQVVNNGKKYAMAAAIGLLAVMVPCVFHLILGDEVPSYPETIADVLEAFLIIYLTTCGAFIVTDLKDKNSRISSFLIPASKLEKFVSRYVLLLIALPLAVIIGVVVGDLVQLLLYSLIMGTSSSVMGNFGHMFSYQLSNNFPVAFIVTWLVHSIYLLLGTVFRRHAWIKSNVSLFAILTALGMIVLLVSKLLLDGLYGEGNYNVLIVDNWWVHTIEYIVILALVAFNYWASFRIYARMQAVNNKWYNF